MKIANFDQKGVSILLGCLSQHQVREVVEGSFARWKCRGALFPIFAPFLFEVHFFPDSLDLPQPLQPVGGVGVAAGAEGLLDLGREVAVQGELAHEDGQVAVGDDLRVLKINMIYAYCRAVLTNR